MATVPAASLWTQGRRARWLWTNGPPMSWRTQVRVRAPRGAAASYGVGQGPPGPARPADRAPAAQVSRAGEQPPGPYAGCRRPGRWPCQQGRQEADEQAGGGNRTDTAVARGEERGMPAVAGIRAPSGRRARPSWRQHSWHGIPWNTNEHSTTRISCAPRVPTTAWPKVSPRSLLTPWPIGTWLRPFPAGPDRHSRVTNATAERTAGVAGDRDDRPST